MYEANSVYYHITLCCVDIVCQAFQSDPLHRQLRDRPLSIVVAAVDFLGETKICYTHAHIFIQPKIKDSFERNIKGMISKSCSFYIELT